ncbi:phospholipase-like protein [Tanacetum coccineum]|uniref:Phospholipase-like protein n=1 Tax=Tanacetum coccineum TaxID=301880 RepID=A0ABQ4YL61_9ASTR
MLNHTFQPISEKVQKTHDPILEFAHYFDPNQPGTESDYDSKDIEEEVEYMADDEVVMNEQKEDNHGYSLNTQHLEEKDVVDKWLNTEITKHMSMQGVKDIKDALISIIKSIRQEMKEDIMKRQFEASAASVGDEVSSIANNKVDKEDDKTSNTTPCRLPKELSPGGFLLPLNINNHSFYATTTLDAKNNIMPQRVYECLGLDKLRGANTIENTTGTNEPLGTINTLVKFGELEFLCNFVIKMVEGVIILGRPFLESTHAQIDVFNEEISFEIGSEKNKFNIDSYQSIEKIYMVSFRQEEETFNPLEIGIDLFSYEYPACLEFEQRTRSYGTPNLQDEIAEPISLSPDRRGLGTLRLWICFRDHERRAVKGSYMGFADFLQGHREQGENKQLPIRPRPCNYSFEEWLKIRIGHNDLHEFDREFIFNEWILDSYDVKEEYAREIGNLYSRRFDEYNRETNESWHDEGYEEDVMWRSGDEKTDYDPPYVNIETFEVKKYSFKGGRSFICITDREDESLPLGRVNGVQFKAMIRKNQRAIIGLHVSYFVLQNPEAKRQLSRPARLIIMWGQRACEKT